MLTERFRTSTPPTTAKKRCGEGKTDDGRLKKTSKEDINTFGGSRGQLTKGRELRGLPGLRQNAEPTHARQQIVSYEGGVNGRETGHSMVEADDVWRTAHETVGLDTRQ